MTTNDKAGYLCYFVALIFAMWDGGQGTGKLLITALAVVVSIVLTGVFSQDGEEA